MNDGRLRIAIVGMGMWGTRAHLPALVSRDDVSVVALCHSHPERIRSMAEKHGITQLYNDMGSLLEGAKHVDAVIIATPDDTHRDLTLSALDAGLHVLCEKPLAHDVSGAREMVTSLRSTHLVGKVGFIFRYSPVLQRMKQLVDEQYIGDIVFFDSTILNAQFMNPTKPFHWKMQRSRTNGGVFVEYGAHMIDLALWLGGPIARVVAHDLTLVTERPLPSGGTGMVDVDDVSSWIAVYANGGDAVFRTSWTSLPVGGCGVRIHGSTGSLAWQVDTNTWSRETLMVSTVDEPQPRTLLDIAPELNEPANVETFPLGLLLFYNARLVDSFVSDVRTGLQSGPSFKDGLAVQYVLAAIHTSLREQRWVEVQMDQRTAWFGTQPTSVR